MDDLQRRRAEFVSRRRILKGDLTRLAADIAAIDRVAQMVDPDYRPEASTRGRPAKSGGAKHLFAPGEMVGAALSALRSLDRPASSGECAQPKLILFDEPTSAMDPEMIREVLDVMTELSAEGLTSLVVTQEMGFARRAADRIVFMEAGEIIENATRDDFFGGLVNPRAQRFLDQILH